MRLMFYIATLHGGGAERVVANLANEFANNRAEVYLVTDDYYNDEYEINNSVKRLILKKTNGCSKIKKNIIQIFSLRKIIKKYKPNVMVSFLPENNFRAHFAMLNLRIRHVVSLRNSPNKVFELSRSGKLIKYVFRKADTIIVQTKDAQEWIKNNIHKNSFIIMNQVAEVFFDTQRSEEKNIVAVGKFLPQKNHMFLIRSFAKIANQIDDNLVIYGEGMLREAYEELVRELKIENRVQLPGFSENLQQVYSKCKMFVLSSDFEGMPNVLLEAMATGTPCISTDCPCGGPRMVIENGVNGRLVTCGNETELAETMLFCLKNDSVRKKMGEIAAKTAKMFEPESIFKQWEKIILQTK